MSKIGHSFQIVNIKKLTFHKFTLSALTLHPRHHECCSQCYQHMHWPFPLTLLSEASTMLQSMLAQALTLLPFIQSIVNAAVNIANASTALPSYPSSKASSMLQSMSSSPSQSIISGREQRRERDSVVPLS